VGQARLEQPVRAVARRGDRAGGQPAAVRRRAAAAHDGRVRGHDVLRSPDRVADAGAGRSRRAPRKDPAARGGRRR
jgi:hypothetical protein